MLKIFVAMLIGAVIGAAVTHELMSPFPAEVPASTSVASASEVGDSQLTVRSPSTDVPDIRVAQPVELPGARRIPRGTGPALVEGSPAAQRMAGRLGLTASHPEIVEATSFAAAFDYALGLRNDPSQFGAALRAVAQRWLVAAPAEAIAALDSLTAPDERQQYIQALTSTAVSNQPELLGDILSRLRGPGEQGSVVNGIARTIQGLDDLEPLLAVGDSLPPAIGQMVRNMVYLNLGQRDPMGALARVAAMPAGQQRQQLLMQSVMQLASRDAAAAMEWLGSQTAELDSNLYQSLGTMLGQQSPELAAQYVASVPESARSAWISAAARGMANSDVDAALNWLNSYRATPWYDDALSGVVQQLAGFDPARAAQLLNEIDTRTMQGQFAVTSVAASWARTDPDRAFTWATGLPAGDARDRALVSLAPAFGEAMLTDATLDLFASERMRDSAVGGVITALAMSDPARAQDLIATHISEPTIAQELANFVESGGEGRRFTAFSLNSGIGISPAIGMPPQSTFIYSDVAPGVPQLTVGPSGNQFRVMQNVVVLDTEER